MASGTKDSGLYGRFKWDEESGSDMARAIKLAVERGATLEEIDILLKTCMIVDKYDLLYNVTLPTVKEELCENSSEEETFIPKLLFFASCEAAQKVLDDLISIAGTYGYASVADYYKLADHRSTGIFKETQFAWDKFDLERVQVNQFGTNYMLNLPEAKRINSKEESK